MVIAKVVSGGQTGGDSVGVEKEGLFADFEQYKKSLIFECMTGKREVA